MNRLRVFHTSGLSNLTTACLLLLISTTPGCSGSSDGDGSLAKQTTDPAVTQTRPDASADSTPPSVTASAAANVPDSTVVTPAAVTPAVVTPTVVTPTVVTPAETAAAPPSRPASPAPAQVEPETTDPQASAISPQNDEATAVAQLEQELAELTVPPEWLAEVTSTWDMAKPWKEARLEIRRLLGKGDDASRREGVKLMWDYRTTGDMGNGHEYGMYLFLGNEPLWAIHAFRERLAEPEHQYPPYFDLKGLAALYTERGLYTEAEKLLQRGLNWPPPDAAWTEMRKAEMHDSLGDLYAAWSRLDDARTHYQKSVTLYPQGKPPYGKHLLPRRAKKVQAKLDLLSLQSLAGAALKDGSWKSTALGYSGDVKLTVRIQNGRIDAIDIQHEEKIDQNATTLIPQRIIDQQSLAVDGVSGATVTKDAIVTGTLEALCKAGLK